MKSFALLFLDIARLRKGPEEVPDSGFLLGVLLLLNIAVGVVVAGTTLGLEDLLWQLVIELLVLVGFLQVALAMRGLGSRFNQTFSAMLGSGMVVSLVSWPILFWLSRLQPDSGQAGPPSVLWMMVFIWSVVIHGHILQRAMGIQRLWANMLAIAYIWGLVWLLQSLSAYVGA